MLSAYNGSEPYIFISYAHKDTPQVMSILQKMREAGFRIWYDKGIQGGFEWPEFIAAKLFASSCVLAFISRNAIESKNCRREINFAIAKDKPLLAVYLEECELPLGMQMQLDTLQALFCTTADEIEDLMQRFLVTEVLQEAREEIKETEPETQTPVITEESATPQQEPDDSTEEETAVAEEQAPPEPTEITELPENPTMQENPETSPPWVCICGKKNPPEARKCSCGNWHCSCGRVNANYVSSCSCGGNKWGEIAKQPARYVSTPVEKKQEKSSWKCTCGKENPLEVRKCSCGNWHCSCNRVHAPYVYSCVCGKSKNG